MVIARLEHLHAVNFAVPRRSASEETGRKRVEIRGDTLREKDEDHRASSCRCSISEAARNIAVESAESSLVDRLDGGFNWLIASSIAIGFACPIKDVFLHLYCSNIT